MLKQIIFGLLLLLPAPGFAASLEVQVEKLDDRDFLPQKFANCVYSTARQENDSGQNISPAISWSEAPLETKSYAIVMQDDDVPKNLSDANKEDKTILEDAKRQTFRHWAIIGIPASKLLLPQNAGRNPSGMGVHAVNDFGHAAYDGPCPPFNDERVHEYNFRVYALDTDFDHLGLKDNFRIKDAIAAIKPHIIAEGGVTMRFSNNPKLK